MTRLSAQTRFILALVLWMLQLAAPLVGLLYIAAKVSRSIALGPQALALGGLCLAWYLAVILVVCFRRGRAWLAGRLPQLFLMYGGLGVGLIALEVLLTVGDVALGLRSCRPHTLSWWAFVPEVPPLWPHVVMDPNKGTRYDLAHIDPNFNAQGFWDRDDFSRAPDGATVKVLLLGDSFGFGCSATADGSRTGFADLLEERLQRDLSAGAVLWNTSMGCTGQKEQLLHLKEYFPVLKPQVVLLAFYEGNDYTDNLFPVCQSYAYTDLGGAFIYSYALDNETVRKLSPREAWLRAHRYPYASAPALARLRTVSIVYRQFPRNPDRPTFDRGVGVTRELLEEAAGYVHRHDAKLLVVVIPTLHAVQRGGETPEHATTLRLLKDLAIPCIDVQPYLTATDYMPPPDLHWSKEGHRKAAELLFETVSRLVDRSVCHGHP